MKPYHHIRTTLLAAALILLVACQKDEGPLEKTGKKVDEAIEQTADAMQGAAETTGEKLKEAGEKIQDSASR
jgi:hypothetical protein